MATRICRCCRLTALVAGVSVTTALAQMPTFSLKAVRVNPECVGGANAGELCTRDEDCDSLDCSGVITPTDCIAPYPGDIIVTEIYASNWSPTGQRLTGFQYTFDTEKFQGVPPAKGELIPYRGPRPCRNDLECADATAACVDDFCNAYDDRAGGLFIRVERPDYVFFDLGQFPFVGFDPYRFGAMLFSPHDGPEYGPPPKYCGTLIVTVSNDAEGVFTLDANTSTEFDTHMRDFDRALILPVETEPLIIHVLGCCVPRQLVSTNPPNCAIDARQPLDPDGSNRDGWDSVEITFAGCDTWRLGSEDFSVREFPMSDPGPFIVEVVPNGKKATVRFSRRIALPGWTCVTYLASGEEVCLAHLPGDVNNDGTSAPTDILYLIDCLNGLRLCEIWQCDVDRSAVCRPPDILRVIDLLNGAAVYDEWRDRSLPKCPSAP
ncbi:MAG: hypothetical protein JSU86_09700 [Phycisphaerales bacterium]|nr:MAG: hypothetical protein JSU86_09700 [Phycisphaerales bacterium]